MKKYIQRSREAYKYTRNMGFTLKFVLLQGILPMMSPIFGADRMRKLNTKLCNKRSKDMLFTTHFGTFVAKSLNGWATITDQYEPRLKESIVKNYKNHPNKKVFLNIGAHIGRWVIELARNYDYYGIAFEPSKETFKYLSANTILSDLTDKIELYNFGLSDVAGIKNFAYISDHDGHSHIVDANEESNTTIETKVFDELNLSINREDIALIIIDVEGHEYEVLKGMKHTLQSLHNVDIIIEIFNDSPHKDEAFDLMKGLGYSFKQLSHADYVFSK